MTAVARQGRLEARRRDSGGAWVAALVVAILALAVWGAWWLGVMAGEGASWRQSLPTLPETLRKAPIPKPPTLPTQRRPTVELELRA
ncbi:hypothetical protein [Caulobacter segnis]|uniref:Uncharacterized protein n=2 Tax=Caulobacter segnis TaxID=88688 RepID=D5VIX8_CAUST|nr:hypothetical protein [Caulobacter segnis]ADG09944.1 hypothetical protein Cseg_1454 [Caulobacter segnis ATCC 21756]